MKSIIFEGVDRLGKDTLIQGVKNRLGYFQTIHYQKPELLDFYLTEARKQTGRADDVTDDAVKSFAAKLYQQKSFCEMFDMLSANRRYIMNRAHLGEFVYAPRYRKYDGSYVFDMEKQFIHDLGSNFHENTLLVLLHTSDFSFIKDDGLSFDFDKKEEEQNDFIRAFERSEIKHKLMLDVNDGLGNQVSREKLLETVIHTFHELPRMEHPILNVSWTYEDGQLVRQNLLQPDPKKLIF